MDLKHNENFYKTIHNLCITFLPNEMVLPNLFTIQNISKKLRTSSINKNTYVELESEVGSLKNNCFKVLASTCLYLSYCKT